MVSELTLSQEASSLVSQYKNIIREQDNKIQSLNEQLKQYQVAGDDMRVSEERTSLKFKCN
jgi:hypothetical protein